MTWGETTLYFHVLGVIYSKYSTELLANILLDIYASNYNATFITMKFTFFTLR